MINLFLKHFYWILRRFIQIFKIKKNSHKYYEGIGKLKFSHPKHEFFPRTFIPDSSMWGLDEIKKENNFSLRTYFEHGIYFGDIILPMQKSNLVDHIVTQSPYRHDLLLNRINKKISVIGNYMYSVKIEKDIDKSFMTNKYCIYFPPHSTKSIRQAFSINESIEFIRNIVGDMKIYISVFYEDYTSENINAIKSLGLQPICFGTRYSPYFLKNIKKSFINAAYIFSCDIGTHIGYALACKKAPIILPTTEKFKVIDDKRYILEKNSYEDFNTALNQKNDIREILINSADEKKEPFENEKLKYVFGLK